MKLLQLPAFGIDRLTLPWLVPWGCLLLFGAGSLFLSSAQAQNVYMRDGEVVTTQGLRRDGSTLLASVKTKEGSLGEVGYPVQNVARIDFPVPAQLKIAHDLLEAGKNEEAVRQLTPILAYYAPFRDIAGAWWTPLALLQVDALGRVGREREVDALLTQIAASAGGADLQREIRIKQATAVEHEGDHQKALNLLEPIVNDATISPVALSEAWLTVGSARLALRDYRDALLAFLHVPVYTPERTALMPAALLGSAGALVGLDDGQRARKALEDLIAAYPHSPEAAQAKERLQRLALPHS